MRGRIEDLQVFVKVVECGNFSSAAEVLGLTPSGVSRLIQRLETRLKAQLFYRSSRQLSVTLEGRRLYERACDIIDQLDQAEQSMSDSQGYSGLIRVNTMLTFAKYQLVRLLPAFNAQYPDITLEFVLGPLPIDMLKQGVDIAIHSGIQPDSGLVAKPLVECNWILCASPAYLKQHGHPATPADLADHNCLHFSMNTKWNQWEFRGAAGSPFRASGWVGSDQGDMILEMALQGLGIARLAEFHVGGLLDDGKLVQVLPSYTIDDTECLYMLYPSRRLFSPRVGVLRQFLEQHFTPTPPWRQKRQGI